MLTWVVIYRRQLQHSTPIPSSLRTLRLCVQLSRPDPARVTAHYCFKSFRRNTYKKRGGRVLQTKYFFSVLAPVRLSLPPVFRTLFQVPYPATSLFATLAKTSGCVPTIPILELDLCARQPHSLIPYPLSIPRLVVSCG